MKTLADRPQGKHLSNNFLKRTNVPLNTIKNAYIYPQKMPQIERF